MKLSSVKETPINFGALVISTLFVAVVYLTIWTVRALMQRRLFPPVRERRIPWTGLQLIFLVLSVELFLPGLVAMAAHQTGLLDRAPPASQAEDTDGGTEQNPDDASSQSPATDSLDRERSKVWLAAVTFPFQIVTIIGFLVVVSGARLSDMGLTGCYFGRNVLLGVIGWVLLAPIVLVLNLVISLLYFNLLRVRVEEHPVTRLMQTETNRLELTLIVFIAVVAAPFLEELMLRGVLQPWFALRRHRGLIALGAALVLATSWRWTKMQTAFTHEGLIAALEEGMAIGFVLLMIPGYFLTRQVVRLVLTLRLSSSLSEPPPRSAVPNEGIQPHPADSVTDQLPPLKIEMDRLVCSREANAMNQAGAIYATSLLFAAAHSFAWPTPISLFVLALGLGYLVFRTQSIIGSITLHAFFNSISVVVLLALP